jgi:hypothetical protein
MYLVKVIMYLVKVIMYLVKVIPDMWRVVCTKLDIYILGLGQKPPPPTPQT